MELWTAVRAHRRRPGQHATKTGRLRYAAMAKRPLKVFRTSAGFQDAYVAATSRKAALEAWGAKTDLFASGIAEQVTESKLTKAALAEPGKVIRLAKGTTAQHLAAAGKGRKTAGKRSATVKDAINEPASATPSPLPPSRKKLPRPSREKLKRVESALEKQTARFAAAITDIESRIDALRQERDQLISKRSTELAKLDGRREKEEDAYRTALDAWDG